jgi:DNA-directed RNA polymerase specialized sigma24 family protein
MQLSLPALVRRCATETDHFYYGRSYDARFAHELFRRALVERDEIAWEHIYTQYGTLVESWVRRSGAFLGSGESSEFFVGAAFTKFWRAVSPERFATFPTLAALLSYLQLCTGSVVIDSVRAQSWAEMVAEEALPADQTTRVSTDDEALERVSRGEFWRYIDTQLNGDAERAVVLGSFVLGMKPGEICDEHPDLFANVGEVYNVKRNVLCRLSRNPELRRRLSA